MNQDGPVAGFLACTKSALTRELLLQSGDNGREILGKIMRRFRGQDVPRPFVIVCRKEMSSVNFPRQTRFLDLDGGNEVKPEQGQIREIVVVQTLSVQVRMDQAQSAQAVTPLAVGGKVGEKHGSCVAHHDHANIPATIDEHAYLTLDFEGELG